MTKYKLEDLKVGAVFKDGYTTRTILAVGKSDVFFTYFTGRFYNTYEEECSAIRHFLEGTSGVLIRPTTKVTYVEYWSCHDLSSKKICSKEIWFNRASPKTNKFIREFEIEVGEDGFPVEGGV